MPITQTHFSLFHSNIPSRWTGHSIDPGLLVNSLNIDNVYEIRDWAETKCSALYTGVVFKGTVTSARAQTEETRSAGV